MRFRRSGRTVLAVALLVAAVWPASGHAISETCREWLQEHEDWRVEVVALYLGGGSQRELDGAMFELMQREAYLTACPASVQAQRGEMVGWRLVGLPVDDYAGIVVVGLLEQAGFDVGLTRLFDPPLRAARAARDAR